MSLLFWLGLTAFAAEPEEDATSEEAPSENEDDESEDADSEEEDASDDDDESEDADPEDDDESEDADPEDDDESEDDDDSEEPAGDEPEAEEDPDAAEEDGDPDAPPPQPTIPLRGVRTQAPLGGGLERFRRARRDRAQKTGQRTTMRPYGQLQVFTTVFDQDEDVQADPGGFGDPEADPGFALARARFGLRGRLASRADQKSRLDYALMIGAGTPFDSETIATRAVGMVDAFLRYSVRATDGPGVGPTSLSIGLAKVPFSREALMSSADLVFMERAVGPENLTSVRDVGATASQAFTFTDDDDGPQIVARGGVYNGNADLLGDTDPGLMYAGRVEFLQGDTYKTWNPERDLAYGVGGALLYDDGLATRRFAWNLDGLVRIGPWSLMGEFGQATLTPTDVTVGAPLVVTQTRRTSWVAHTSVWIGKKTGQGVEVAVRASGFDDNIRLDDNGDVLILHAGATARDILPFLDFGIGYIHREELQGTPIANDTIRIITQIRPSR
jgi:hypothetical protein